MAEYINRELALAVCPSIARETIEAIPSADVVERKRGKWFKNDIGYIRCPICGYNDFVERLDYFSFCPNCGADMRGEADGNSFQNGNYHSKGDDDG